MRLLFLLTFIILPLLSFGQHLSQQKLDSLKMDTLLSALRHDFVEKQFNYCLGRIDKLENRIEKMESGRGQDIYWIAGFVIFALFALRLGWLDKLQKKE